jgi:superfamily II DNA/RNA helicase
MLQQFLADRGFTVVCLNGSMDMDERTRVQGAFATDVQILISTDAGGEGYATQRRLRTGKPDRVGSTDAA